MKPPVVVDEARGKLILAEEPSKTQVELSASGHRARSHPGERGRETPSRLGARNRPGSPRPFAAATASTATTTDQVVPAPLPVDSLRETAQERVRSPTTHTTPPVRAAGRPAWQSSESRVGACCAGGAGEATCCGRHHLPARSVEAAPRRSARHPHSPDRGTRGTRERPPSRPNVAKPSSGPDPRPGRKPSTRRRTTACARPSSTSADAQSRFPRIERGEPWAVAVWSASKHRPTCTTESAGRTCCSSRPTSAMAE